MFVTTKLLALALVILSVTARKGWRTKQCGPGAQLIANLFDRTRLGFTCDMFNTLTDQLYDECDEDDKLSSLRGLSRLINIYDDMDCDDNDCEEAFECFEDLLDDNKIDCGDDEETLEKAQKCLDDLDSDCDYLDKLKEIIEDEDDICPSKQRGRRRYYWPRSIRRLTYRMFY